MSQPRTTSERPRTVRPPRADVALFAGRYRILDEIASGGMGVVYRAQDEASGLHVALKQLRPESANKPHAASLFEREYQTLAHIAHPYIIRVYEYGFSEAGPYYTMELLEGGGDLQTIAPLPYREVCRHLRDIATSLALLHARRLVHRDVTPRNVYRTAEGRCKLLDFGALASFGSSNEILGTPAFIAPEVMNQQSLDQRTDLYSLGALAYWMLTGQPAFAARRMDDLFELWRRRPVLPSKLAEGLAARNHAHFDAIPPQLDELVLTLLALEPQARPRHAAEVIERLNVIAGLEPEPRANAAALAQAYLTNATLVGRDSLLARFDIALDKAVHGTPGRALIVGESGFGRTRMLADVALKASLGGFVVLRAEASGSHPFATMQVLANSLFNVLPKQARESARSYTQVLAHLGPEIAAHLGVTTQARGARAAGEWRDQLADAMRRWLTRVAEEHSLLLAVDNLERADEASLALLASLHSSKRTSKLFVLGTCSSVEPHATSNGLKALVRVSDEFKLEALTQADTEELLRTIFGDGANLTRCSKWIYDLTAGRPLHCIELVNTLLSDGGVRFADGIWLLPAERPELTLSADLAQALTARLKGLSPEALALAQALCLVKGTLTVELCLALAQRSPQSAHLILEELVQSRILVIDGKFCRFSNDALRQTLNLRLNREELSMHHRQIGGVLLALPKLDSFTKLQAGNHLMEGGERRRGAECVYSVAASPMEEMSDSLYLFAPILARAYDELEASGASRAMCLPLLLGLADASFYADWRWAQRYGQKTLDAIEDVLGIALARRLGRLVGRRLAILISLLFATLRYVVLRPRVHPTVGEVFMRSIVSASSLVGAAASVFDRQTAHRATETLRALSWLGKRSALDGAHDFSVALQSLIEDNLHLSSTRFAELVTRFADTRNYREISPASRLLWVGGARYALGINQTMKASSEVLDTAEALANGNIALHRMLAGQLRRAYHLCRGELDKADSHRDSVEAYAILVGSAWQAEIWESVISAVLFMRSGDVVNAKRVSELFADLSQRIPSLVFYAAQARASLEFARGEYATAEQIWLEILEARAPRSFAGWSVARSNLAAAYNAQQEHQKAEALCRDTLTFVLPNDADYPLVSLWIHMEYAFAEAGLGRGADAAARLERLLADDAAGENPFLRGMLHGARARVAFSMGDQYVFEQQVAQACQWFLTTNNPALVRRAEQLKLMALQAPWRPPSFRPPAVSETFEQLVHCADRSARNQLALDAILQMSNARSGLLFERTGIELSLVAKTGYSEVPSEALTRARSLLDELLDGTTALMDSSTQQEQTNLDVPAPRYRILPLTFEQGGELVIVGAVAVPENAELHSPGQADLEAIARGLIARYAPDSLDGLTR